LPLLSVLVSEKRGKVVVDEYPSTARLAGGDQSPLGTAAHFLGVHLQEAGGLQQSERIHVKDRSGGVQPCRPAANNPGERTNQQPMCDRGEKNVAYLMEISVAAVAWAPGDEFKQRIIGRSGSPCGGRNARSARASDEVSHRQAARVAVASDERRPFGCRPHVLTLSERIAMYITDFDTSWTRPARSARAKARRGRWRSSTLTW
jgi:hypothetical protein